MPLDRRYVFAALAFVAVVYICYKYKHDKKKIIECGNKTGQNTRKTPQCPTVTTKFNTRIIPLKPPRNDSFSKASPLHYKFNYSDPQYDTIDDKNNNDKANQHQVTPSNANQFKVVTFNVLATCYALKSNSYASYCPPEHLKGEYRFTQIGKILEKCNGDIIALQEVDKPRDTLKWMGFDNNKQYKIMYYKRTNKKQDGLILGYKMDKFQLYNNTPMRVIKLNDLTMGCASENTQQYFKKDQIAIYLILQPIHHPSHLLFVINTHLYWHPDACNIRLRQIAYLLNIINEKCQQIEDYDSSIKQISLIFPGDFNTLPSTSPHEFMLNGEYTMKAKGNSTLKLMMDSALNKVARWCRSLGVDCAYNAEQKLDTKNANKLFEQCRKENRILITRAKRLAARRECPPHLLLNNHEPRDNLKQIIKYFGIEYDDDAIFTRCTLCNGYFKRLEQAQDIENDEQIPMDLKLQAQSMTFWKCLKCGQVYWFGGKSKNEVEKFKRIFEEASVEIDKELKESKEKLKKRILKRKQKMEYKKQLKMQQKQESDNKYDDNDKEEDEAVYESDIGDLDDKLRLLPNLQRFFWENVEFRHPFGNRIKCSYSEYHGKPAKYTNKTSKFKGCLDYIFYADLMASNTQQSMKCIDSELVEGDKKYYPNSSWPSDHILLMSTFEIQQNHN